MEGIVCDRCGDGLLIDSDVRYIVRIESFAAYDPMELTSKDLERDFEKEYEALLAKIEAQSSAEVEAQVYSKRSFDLCPRCRREFLESPFGGSGAQGAGSAPDGSGRGAPETDEPRADDSDPEP